MLRVDTQLQGERQKQVKDIIAFTLLRIGQEQGLIHAVLTFVNRKTFKYSCLFDN